MVNRVEEKCDYLHSAIHNDGVEEDLREWCKDVCTKCIDGCTAMDFVNHEYFS